MLRIIETALRRMSHSVRTEEDGRPLAGGAGPTDEEDVAWEQWIEAQLRETEAWLRGSRLG